MNIGNCKDANKTIVEIPVGEKLECPTCHKDMLVEVKDGVSLAKIGAIVAAVVVLGGAGAYFGGLFDGNSGNETDALKTDSIAVVDSVPAAGGSDSEVNVDSDGKDVDEVPKPGVSTAAPVVVNLDYASYDGPMSEGKPHGIGGTLIIKKNHSIDLKDAKGGMLDVKPGDKIVNTKFTNGKLNQGELQRKNGERNYFVIG